MKNIKFLFILLFFDFIQIAAQSEYNSNIKSLTILKTDTTSIGQKLKYPDVSHAEVTGLRVIIPPKMETGWHRHNVPGFAYVIKGVLTIETEDGRDLKFDAGSTFAEMVDKMHNGKNLGTEDVELIAFFLGEKDKAFTKKKK